MKKIVLTFLLVLNFCYSQVNSKYPVRVILNLTSEPDKSMAVTWQTFDKIKDPVAQVAEESDWIDFVKSAQTINSKIERVQIDSIKFVYHYSAVMNDLKPNSRYVYRVGGDSVWSEWNEFTTAKNETAPFEFVFFGDPQVGFRDYLPRLFRRALLTVPNAKFWLYIGDITDRPKLDQQWNDLFFSLDFIPRIVPSVMIPGNHEYARQKNSPFNTRGLTHLWKPHFTLPENGADSLNETSYYFDYQGVRFIMLNGQERLAEQAIWMEKLLANNPNKWTIAVVHQPVYSMGADRDEKDIRNTFMPLFDKYSVDLVLTGHDHVYSRSFKLKNGSIVKDNEKGTVYAVSVCGTKMYKLTLKYKDLMAKYGENIQLFQVISINSNKLTYKSYTLTNNLYDSFELVK